MGELPAHAEAEEAPAAATEILSAEAEQEQIRQLNHEPSKEGEIFYVLDHSWFDQWKKYVRYNPSTISCNTPRPGPIDNSQLVDDSASSKDISQHPPLRQRLFAGHHYDFVPEQVWNKFIQWYGGGPAFPRKTTTAGSLQSVKVEIYPLELEIAHNANPNDTKLFTFSRGDLVKDMKVQVCEAMGIQNPDKIRIFRYPGRTKLTEIKQTEEKLGKALVYTTGKAALLFEEEGIETPKPSYLQTQMSSSRTSEYSSSYSAMGLNRGDSLTPSSSSYSSAGSFLRAKPKQPGLTGLRNVGNTCFMNSALQCLSNSIPLAQYFLERKHIPELNKTNPLGKQGDFANAFGSLMAQLWSGDVAEVNPDAFKRIVGKHAPNFSGFGQQDAQEFLACLLDGLHEDLNRVEDKPLVCKREGGLSDDDETVAELSWQDHLKRNRSVIVDHFVGQYKSKVCCPDCSKISITFDPFMYLTLPLPEKTSQVRQLEIWPTASNFPTRYALKLPPHCSVRDLKERASATANLPVHSLVVAEIEDYQFVRVYKESEFLARPDKKRVIAVYQMADASDPTPSTALIKVHVYGERKESFYRSTEKVWAHPFLLHVKRASTLRDLYAACWQQLDHLYLDSNSDSSEISPFDSTNDDMIQVISEWLTLSLQDHLHKVFFQGHSLDHVVHLNHGSTIEVMWNTKELRAIDTKNLTKVKVDSSVNTVKEESALVKTTLQDCFHEFVQEERLSETDMWYCSSCSEMRQATKKMDIYRLPEILVIHLKRFRSYGGTMLGEKISTEVQFPLSFDTAPYTLTTQKDSTYDLYAICNHIGAMGFGHYTAYCKSKEDENWYNYNDSTVTPISTTQLQSNSAYLLFYRQRKTDDSKL